MNGDRWVHVAPAQQIAVGSGVVDGLPEIMRALGMRRIVVLTSPGRAASPTVERVVARLGRAHVATSAVAEPLVPATAVQRAVAEFRGTGADAIVAVGGGSAIDTAKAVAFFAEQEAGTPAAGFADRPVVPIVAVPTTLVGAGFTSSFAMVDPQSRRSSVAGTPTMMPAAVLADPEPLADLEPLDRSRSVAAALAQAVDVALSSETDPEGVALAVAAIASLVRGIDGLADPDPTALSPLLDGSVLAGRAMQASPDGLQRALVRLVAARSGAPWGAVHAALVVHTTRMVADVAPEPVVRSLTDALSDGHAAVDGPGRTRAADELPGLLAGVLQRLGTTDGLGSLGVSDDDLDAVARQSAAQRGIQRSPRPLGESDVRALLDDAC